MDTARPVVAPPSRPPAPEGGRSAQVGRGADRSGEAAPEGGRSREVTRQVGGPRAAGRETDRSREMTPESGRSREVAPSRGRATAARRRARQQEIVASTRELFDARGMRAANIDDIARAVGINRAIIYRHFASKEELFALALAEYLTELDGRLSGVDDEGAAPRDRLAAVAREFAGYCLRYPAFVDCALALLGRPGADLLAEISDTALLRLGGLMAAQLRRIAAILRGGAVADGTGPDLIAATGGGDATDPDLLANALYMQTLGVMHLARSGVVLRPTAGGEVSWGTVADQQIVDLVIRMTLAVAFPH